MHFTCAKFQIFRTNMIGLLIDSGVVVDSTDKYGRTPLFIAAEVKILEY